MVLGHVIVPKRRDALHSLALRLPLTDHTFVDAVDDFDEEGISARGGVQDLHEGLVG